MPRKCLFSLTLIIRIMLANYKFLRYFRTNSPLIEIEAVSLQTNL